MGLCVLGMADTSSEPSNAAIPALTRQRQNTQPMWDVFFHACSRSNITSVSMHCKIRAELYWWCWFLLHVQSRLEFALGGSVCPRLSTTC